MLNKLPKYFILIKNITNTSFVHIDILIILCFQFRIHIKNFDFIIRVHPSYFLLWLTIWDISHLTIIMEWLPTFWCKFSYPYLNICLDKKRITQSVALTPYLPNLAIFPLTINYWATRSRRRILLGAPFGKNILRRKRWTNYIQISTGSLDYNFDIWNQYLLRKDC